MPNAMSCIDWLLECTGDTIWPVEYARARGIPVDWVDAMADAFESGFDDDRQTIYHQETVVGQFHGIRDVDLARRIATELGLDIATLESRSLSRRHLVQNIYEAYEEM